MARRYCLVVSIWIHPGQEAAFDVFEREAARRMAIHGGRIDAAVRTAPSGTATSPGDVAAYEVHIVSFPDRASAQAYANDPGTLALRRKRTEIVAQTIVAPGVEAGPY